MKKFFRKFSHLIFQPNRFKKKQIKSFAKNVKNNKILEIGSGKKEKGRYYYSCIDLFDNSNEFIQSDFIKEFDHYIIDITNFDLNEEYDVILCTNVLEHIFDYKKAIENIYKALKKDGIAVIMVPGFYPLHDEPNDFWRFTEHALRKLLKDFKEIKLKYSGLRQYPFAYYIEAYK